MAKYWLNEPGTKEYAKKFPNIDWVARNGVEKNGTTFKLGAFKLYEEIGNHPNDKEQISNYIIYSRTEHFLKIIKLDPKDTQGDKKIIQDKSGKNIKIMTNQYNIEVIDLGYDIISAYELCETTA